MRAISVLVLLCVGVVVALAFQSIRQELSIQALREHSENAARQVRKYEDAIVQAKLKIQEVNKLIVTESFKKKELTKKKLDVSKAGLVVQKNIQDCQKQKTDAENKMNSAIENLQKAKAEAEGKKEEVDEEIVDLKRRILERDMKFCEYVDVKFEEGRKLCGIEAPK